MSTNTRYTGQGAEERERDPFHMGRQAVCEVHQSPFQFVCKNCDETLVCLDCVTSTHQYHGFDKISAFAQTKKTKIEDFMREVENTKLPILRKQMRSLDEEIVKNSETFAQIANQINCQSEKIKSEIDKITKELLLKCTEIGQQNNTSLLQYKEQLQNFDTKLMVELETCQAALNSEDNIRVIDTASKIQTKPQKPKHPSLQTASFKERIISKKELQQNMLGSLMVQTRNFLHTVSEFKLKGLIKSVEKSTSDCVWVSYWNERYISLVSNTGELRKEIKMSSNVCDISLSHNTGNLWVYCQDNGIYEIVGNIPCKQFKANPYPQCMCVTSQGTVVVGSEQNLSQYSKHGWVLQSLNSNNMFRKYLNQEHQISSPYRVRSCQHTGDIAVCDSDWSKHGGKDMPHITVFDSKLQLKYRYYGNVLPQFGCPTGVSGFHPFDAVFDSLGNLLIADYEGNSMQLVDSQGKCLTLYPTDQLKPISLVLLHNGLMLIAFKHKTLILFDKC